MWAMGVKGNAIRARAWESFHPKSAGSFHRAGKLLFRREKEEGSIILSPTPVDNFSQG
jgi:hypothetical protein